MFDVMALVRNVFENEAAAAMTSGAIVLGIIGWIGYQARALPLQLMNLIESQFTVQMTLQYGDAAFHRLDVWLTKQAHMKRARRVSVARWYDNAQDRHVYALTAGEGRHFMFSLGRWWMITRSVSQPGGAQNGSQPQSASGSNFGMRQETLTFTTWGRQQAPLQALLEEAERVFGEAEREPRTRVLNWNYGYSEVAVKPVRPLDTIYMEDAVKAEIMRDVDAFMARRKWYAERAIPWRRGYMFVSPPGCGKSTLIQAIAGHLNLPVFMINPGSVGSDSGLLSALNTPMSGVYAIEDIDSVEILKARPNLELVAEQEERWAGRGDGRSAGSQVERATISPSRLPPPTAAVHVNTSNQAPLLTLSGFLNAIDGAGSGEGRILIATTNTPDALDPALMRAGRFDRVFRLRAAHGAEARAMFTRFFPESDADAFMRAIGPRLPMAQAELQNLMLQLAEAGDPVGALQEEIARRFAA